MVNSSAKEGGFLKKKTNQPCPAGTPSHDLWTCGIHVPNIGPRTAFDIAARKPLPPARNTAPADPGSAVSDFWSKGQRRSWRMPSFTGTLKGSTNPPNLWKSHKCEDLNLNRLISGSMKRGRMVGSVGLMIFRIPNQGAQAGFTSSEQGL